MTKKIAIIGGGAGGFFGAINILENCPKNQVSIFEATNKVLSKVLISGGGRCNVTNNLPDPAELSHKYPRGGKELLGPLYKFGPHETMNWFTKRGVELKTEADKRVFPVSNDSRTIADCLVSSMKNLGGRIRINERVKRISKDTETGLFNLETTNTNEPFDKILLASGGSERSFELAKSLGHTIIPPVPSLFTFEIESNIIKDLPGVSFEMAEATLCFGKRAYSNRGPLLITHWGLSGPCVIVLSSVCARDLYDVNYHAELKVNFMPDRSLEKAQNIIKAFRDKNLKKKVINAKPFEIPNSFWERVLDIAILKSDLTWQEVSAKNMSDLLNILLNSSFQIKGKGKFKEEFVTSGGVSLKEVDFRTMESKICKGLYFSGEVLDIDGVTGGFNFQSAWTTAWIASQNM